MTTKDALRQQVQRLLKLGITQKAIAVRMGMSQAAFSRWMNDDAARIDTDALDGFNAYQRELRTLLGEETQRSEASAEPIPALATGTAGSSFRHGKKPVHHHPPASQKTARRSGS